MVGGSSNELGCLLDRGLVTGVLEGAVRELQWLGFVLKLENDGLMLGMFEIKVGECVGQLLWLRTRETGMEVGIKVVGVLRIEFVAD